MGTQARTPVLIGAEGAPLHAIATLVHRSRGRLDDGGLSTANGWFLTKLVPE